MVTGGQILPLLKCFYTLSCQIWSSHDFRCCGKKCFSVICYLAVTTRKAVGYSGEIFFQGNFASKQVTKSASGSKNNITLAKWYIFFQSWVLNVFSNQEKIYLYGETCTLIAVVELSNSLYFWQIIYLRFFWCMSKWSSLGSRCLWRLTSEY